MKKVSTAAAKQSKNFSEQRPCINCLLLDRHRRIVAPNLATKHPSCG